jgi:16S rRNA (guanine1207-N2)-methyltransferase
MKNPRRRPEQGAPRRAAPPKHSDRSATQPKDEYYCPRQLTAMLGGAPVQVVTKLGLPDWDGLSPAADLLADLVAVSAGEKTLAFGVGCGAWSVPLARRAGAANLRLTDASILAWQMAALTFQANDLAEPSFWHPAQEPAGGPFAAAVIELPKGRKLARRWLRQAYDALQPGGALYLGGANDAGVQAAIKDAGELFGNAAVLGYRKGCRVARMVRDAPNSSHRPPWVAAPGIGAGTAHEFTAHLPGSDIILNSLPGVFAADGLDAGTALLLAHVIVPAGGRVLDFGCGYGVIGLWAAQRGAAAVDLIDANLLAVACAQANAERNGIANARALAGDLLAPAAGERYAAVLSNPPFHTGAAVDYAVAQAFIAQAWQALLPGGRLTLVANRFIRYERALQAAFGNVRRLADTGRFHVLEASKA